MKKRIVILGGGYGGVYAGKLLHKKLKKNEDVEITLIDKQPYHTLMTELHEVAGNRTPEDSVRVSLEKIFAKRKVDVVLDEINDIDLENKVLKSVNNKSYEYDYLVLGTGAQPTYFGIDGADENTYTLWSYEDALRIKEHVLDMFRAAEKETNEAKRREMLTFVVVGGGFTGVEMVGELAEWTKKLSKEYEVNADEVKVYNVDAMGSICLMLSEKLQNKAIARLEKLGIEVLLNSPINKVTKNSVVIGEDKEISTRTCIWTAGVKSSDFSERLGLTPGKRGGIQTNAHMQTLEYDNVYVVGDNVSYVEDEVGPLPKIVETAHFTAETAAHNIDADIKDKEKIEHKSHYHGVMVSLGSRYAVASVGEKKKIEMSGWFAMLTKHLVNMLYLIQIAGLSQVWTYMLHEFFHIKDRRSFVGGHFSKSSPNFWLVPLRVWLGYMWIVEGVKKISEGWLTEVKIVATNAGDAVTGATDAVADATTAATEVVTGGADAIAELPSFAAWAVDHMPGGYGEALLGQENWIVTTMNNIMSSLPEGLLMFMQISMIILEIVIGICLIVGLFTFLWSALSVVITIGITMTGMSDATILWFTFAGVALIGGSGSTFGLDYYVLPWLKKRWKKIGIVKKWYLYAD